MHNSGEEKGVPFARAAVQGATLTHARPLRVGVVRKQTILKETPFTANYHHLQLTA